ncbi:DUF4397 domain-containing protein [Pedobacter punctiformis]|uniref:DUF4397 domain-containing protein n=1 Tax=Pedobacter punctiformis TaxID=3004097 RepID=A0ABT4L4G2_9SPHI|nr:DUF4397 domain-containing protein [Pedobacter sp. HCMS5-2]MCZ4242811.1 DUF4397 domain-containing protein [Pedobacter sp. HCMS5-2]
MKNFTLFKRLTLQSFLLLLTIVSLFSCQKTEPSDTPTTSLRVINASPASATYNVYLGGTPINTVALPFTGASTYKSGLPGAYSIKFTTANSTESLFSKDISLAQSIYSSFYLLNKPGQLDGLLTTDDLSIPDASKAYIRFINLAPDAATALDLAKTGSTSALISNKAYKAISNFIAVDAGSYAFDAKETGGLTVKATLAGAILTAGYHYDVICAGLSNPANDTERPLTLQVIKIQ